MHMTFASQLLPLLECLTGGFSRGGYALSLQSSLALLDVAGRNAYC